MKPRGPRAQGGEQAQRTGRRTVNTSDDAAERGHVNDAANTMYGLNPVLEALRVGHTRVEQITIADGVRHERMHELLELAKQARVLVHRVPRAAVDRLVPGVAHQGVVA